MSGGLCPSRSTVYIGNLPYSLTNNDIHKLLEKYGKVVKVTIVKDKETHKSSGVAFVLFLKKEDAQTCVRALNKTQLFGRTLKCAIAKDNGRTTEFIRRKVYKDKSRCYECGEAGHLSYYCPHNMLGDREPEKKKKKRKFRSERGEYGSNDEQSDAEEEEEDEGEDPALESLGAAIRYQQEKMEQEYQARNAASGENDSSSSIVKRKRFKKSDYFSDEEEVVE